MKRRLQIILLLWSCILMQAVSVFPHHHHADMPCLHHDAETPRQATAPHGCSSGCITRFNLDMPSERPVLHGKAERKTDTGRISFPYGEFLLSVPENHIRHTCSAPPSFYESPTSGGTGLRAPPCSLFS